MTDFRIKLLPPDIAPAVLNSFAHALAATATAPDQQLAAFHGSFNPYFPEHSLLGLSSGTAALHLALRLLGIGQDDYVICPSFTFSATVNAILYQQATPVFIDSEAQSWNMDPLLLEEALEDMGKKGRKPGAIIVVHAYGTPAKIAEIQALASHYQIPLIEDAAPALGAAYQGQMLGTFGLLGAFSFNYNKIITTAGGGLLLSKEETLIRQADYLANQARTEAPFYLHETWGYNYKMSGLAAQLGKVQAGLLEEKIASKKEIFNTYRQGLEGTAGIEFQDLAAEMSPNYWLSSFLMKSEKDKLKAYKHLHAAGIEGRMLWRPLHLQPAYGHFPGYLNGVAKMLFQRGLSLPSACSLSQEEQTTVIDRLKSL